MSFLISGCGGRSDKPIVWDLNLKGTPKGVLLDLTGASILFEGLSYVGESGGEVTIYKPNVRRDPYGIGTSVEGWGAPAKEGRAKLDVSFWSRDQKCEIVFGEYTIAITDHGKNIEISGSRFTINPETKPSFIVKMVDGEVRVKQM